MADGEQVEARLPRAVPRSARHRENVDSDLALYELAGGSIINVIHYACLQALGRSKDKLLAHKDLIRGIELEVEKSGKVFRQLR